MSEFRAEKPENRVKMAEMSKPDIPAKELTQPDTGKVSSSFGSNFKARLASLKVKATAPVPVRPSVPVEDGVASLAQQEIELGMKAIEQDELEKKTQIILSNDVSYYEQMSDIGSRDRFFEIFKNTVNENIGLNLDEIRDKIMAMHVILFDTKAGMQGLMALRQDQLKDASAEERQKRMKEDFTIKMPKKSGNGEVKVRAKSSGGKAKAEQKEDPYDQMKRTMVDKWILKGKTREEATAIADKKIAALKGDD